tara:strand:- start:551 stop:1252 length:702 start_codon:yes stop_codon:yes gene_type:complete
MPFICLPPTQKKKDIVRVLVTDFFPNKVQSNSVITPLSQGPRYFTAIFKDFLNTKPVIAAGAVAGAVSGLSAYLLTTVEVSSDGDRALTADESFNIAQDIIDRMTTAQALTSSAVNALIQAETADQGDADGIGKGNSTATVLEILQILSGTHTFTVPDAQVVEVAGTFQALLANAQAALFTASATNTPISSSYDSFFISARSGQIALAQAKTSASGASTPVLVAYNNDGSLIQ